MASQRTFSVRVQPFQDILMNEFSATDDALAANRSAAIFSTGDLAGDPDLLTRLIRENPQQTIKFKRFVRVPPSEVGFDPRLRHVKNIYHLPAGVWARWFLSQVWFQWIIFVTIAINCILIVLETTVDPALAPLLFQIIDILSSVCTIVFLIEIIIRWIDSFKDYWKDFWNIFDFLLTIATLPDLITVMIPISVLRQPNVVDATNLVMRIGRALRALRIISWFDSLRVIVVTAFKALGALGYLVLLLLISMFLFAVFGLAFFEDFAESAPSQYTPHWQNLATAMLGLFQVVTYDHWLNHLHDVMRVSQPIVAIVFFLVWLILGGFIFRNVFVGIMVQYFQDIKADIIRQEQASRRATDVARLQTKIAHRMASRSRRELQALQAAQAATLTRANATAQERREVEMDALRSQILATEDAAQSGDMGKLVRMLSQPNMVDKPAQWPRDALMEYLMRMSQLQENMAEQQELFRLANISLHNMVGEDERRVASRRTE